MSHSEKLLRLLKEISLIDRACGASLRELKAECEISDRTVYRDLDALSQSGLPVYIDPGTRRYRFTSQVFLQPLTFSVEEATALVQCVQGLCKAELPLRADLRQAMEKILSSLPGERQKKVDAGRQAVDIRLTPHPVAVGKDMFRHVEAAVRDRQRIRVRYYTKSREMWTERILDPYVIVFRGRAWYVVAFCHLRGGVKLFRLDRMGEATLLHTTFELPKNFSPDAFFAGSWLIEQGDLMRVKLKFTPEVARWLKDEHYHDSQETEELPDGSLLFTATVRGMREITRWVLGFGAGVEVLEPKELRDAVAAEGNRMAGLYGG